MHRVTIDRSASVATIVAGGELDAYGAPELSSAFSELARDTCVVVDLGAVSFMDSTALGVVVRSVREIEERGDDSRVVLPRGTARRIFEITMLDRVLPVAETRAQALAALAGTT
jgi:anti-sigma B factor antagonist